MTGRFSGKWKLAAAVLVVLGQPLAAQDKKPQPAPAPGTNSLAAPAAAGQTPAVTAPALFDPLSLLGLDLAAAYEKLGAPDEILTAKIDEKTIQPVHFYLPALYLFWTQNHVWQVRLDKRTTGEVVGLKMGVTRDEALTRLGKALGSGSDWDVWQLPYKGFPRRVRLIWDSAGKLTDAYLYRSDF